MEDLREHGQREPQEEDELESVVEGEPINDAEQALKDGEKGENDPVLQCVSHAIIISKKDGK